MPQFNLISEVLSTQAVQDIQLAIDSLKTNLPFLINLSPAERQSNARIGDKTLAFAEKALRHAKRNPQLVPSFLDVTEFERDLVLREQLQEILEAMRSLTEALEDTFHQAGSEAFQAALTFYRAVKNAKMANSPGTDVIYEDMRKRFESNGPGGNTLVPGEEEPPPPEE